MVINFDGLGSNKTTSICDGKYNKIATFAPNLITFNQPLAIDVINTRIRRSTETVTINNNSSL
jgi:hypothetical protein